MGIAIERNKIQSVDEIGILVDALALKEKI